MGYGWMRPARPWDLARRLHGPGFEGLDGIASGELRAEHIPAPGSSWSLVGEFALTFDGYAYAGGFTELAERANALEERYVRTGVIPDALELDELRAMLFFEQRRWRHFGDAPEGEAER